MSRERAVDGLHRGYNLPTNDPRYTVHVDTAFGLKDSGKREEYASGMVRDTSDDKIRYDLTFDGPMLERYAKHLTKGAIKYSPRNWLKASGQEELDRFQASAVRHMFQWLRGDTDEDHAAAVWFNINGAEFVKEKL